MISFPNPGIIAGPRGGAPVLLRTFGSIVNVSSGDLALGLPSGSEGQLLVAQIGYRGTPTFSAPGGWTIAYQDGGDTTGAGDAGIMVAYKTRGASESAPTFTRSGGDRGGGIVTGYEPSRGALTFASMTQNASSGTTSSVGSLTSAGSKSLIVVTHSKSNFQAAAIAGLSAASLGAASSPGSFVTPGDPVATDPWQNTFVAGQSLTAQTTVQGFDLLREGAGASGTISVSGLSAGGFHMVAIDFGWLP